MLKYKTLDEQINEDVLELLNNKFNDDFQINQLSLDNLLNNKSILSFIRNIKDNGGFAFKTINDTEFLLYGIYLAQFKYADVNNSYNEIDKPINKLILALLLIEGLDISETGLFVKILSLYTINNFSYLATCGLGMYDVGLWQNVFSEITVNDTVEKEDEITKCICAILTGKSVEHSHISIVNEAVNKIRYALAELATCYKDFQ